MTLIKVKRQLLSILGFLRLEKIFICPSHKCNANCVHCYEKFKGNDKKWSLTTNQVKNIIDQFRGLKGHYVYYCSGEFLLRDDALELIGYTKYNNMSVSVTTNGLLLNEKKINELKSAGLTDLMVSIDNPIEAEHDTLRGVKGCFNNAIEGLKIAKEKGINVQIWTYVTKTNYNDLETMAKLCEKMKITNAFVFFPLLSGYLFNRFNENLSYDERETFRKQFNNNPYIELEFASEKGQCRGGGKEHICVMPSGEVTFCPAVPYSYGNIKTKPLKDCLKGILKDYKRFSHLTGQCIVNFPEYRKNCKAKFIY